MESARARSVRPLAPLEQLSTALSVQDRRFVSRISISRRCCNWSEFVARTGTGVATATLATTVAVLETSTSAIRRPRFSR